MEKTTSFDLPDDELLKQFAGKTVFISGATGLIGGALIRRFLAFNQGVDSPVRVLALVRDLEKAKRMFSCDGTDSLRFIVGDVTASIACDEPVDYMIHAASMTSSKAFVTQPAETILTSVKGTFQMLELAREKHVSGFAYLSSMEVYGSPVTDEKIFENHSTNLDTMSVRTSYPESKRLCESLCTAYYSEYGVPAMVVRLTQTFGPGVKYDDGRVFAEFARCAIEKRDIILHTKGETKRCYLFTEDAVSAILTVLLRGTPGQAYNAANEDTYCSIYKMAQLVAQECAGGQIVVRIEQDHVERGYAPTLKMNLDTGRLLDLGWRPRTGLREMYTQMIRAMREQL